MNCNEGTLTATSSTRWLFTLKDHFDTHNVMSYNSSLRTPILSVSTIESLSKFIKSFKRKLTMAPPLTFRQNKRELVLGTYESQFLIFTWIQKDWSSCSLAHEMWYPLGSRPKKIWRWTRVYHFENSVYIYHLHSESRLGFLGCFQCSPWTEKNLTENVICCYVP